MRKLLVLHGWLGNSETNWSPWLRQVGEQQGWNVITPSLPEPEAPVLFDWINTAREAAGELQSGDVIIGHSMGGKAVIHLVEQNLISGVTCILIGPTYDTIEDELDLGDPPDIKQKLRDFHELSVDFEKLNTLGNKYIVFLSYDDHLIPFESAQKYYKQLEDVHFIEFENAGHFRDKDGFVEFPDIFPYIKG